MNATSNQPSTVDVSRPVDHEAMLRVLSSRTAPLSERLAAARHAKSCPACARQLLLDEEERLVNAVRPATETEPVEGLVWENLSGPAGVRPGDGSAPVVTEGFPGHHGRLRWRGRDSALAGQLVLLRWSADAERALGTALSGEHARFCQVDADGNYEVTLAEDASWALACRVALAQEEGIFRVLSAQALTSLDVIQPMVTQALKDALAALEDETGEPREALGLKDKGAMIDNLAAALQAKAAEASRSNWVHPSGAITASDHMQTVRGLGGVRNSIRQLAQLQEMTGVWQRFTSETVREPMAQGLRSADYLTILQAAGPPPPMSLVDWIRPAIAPLAAADSPSRDGIESPYCPVFLADTSGGLQPLSTVSARILEATIDRSGRVRIDVTLTGDLTDLQDYILSVILPQRAIASDHPLLGRAVLEVALDETLLPPKLREQLAEKAPVSLLENLREYVRFVLHPALT